MPLPPPPLDTSCSIIDDDCVVGSTYYIYATKAVSLVTPINAYLVGTVVVTKQMALDGNIDFYILDITNHYPTDEYSVGIQLVDGCGQYSSFELLDSGGGGIPFLNNPKFVSYTSTKSYGNDSEALADGSAECYYGYSSNGLTWYNSPAQVWTGAETEYDWGTSVYQNGYKGRFCIMKAGQPLTAICDTRKIPTCNLDSVIKNGKYLFHITDGLSTDTHPLYVNTTGSINLTILRVGESAHYLTILVSPTGVLSYEVAPPAWVNDILDLSAVTWVVGINMTCFTDVSVGGQGLYKVEFETRQTHNYSDGITLISNPVTKSIEAQFDYISAIGIGAYSNTTNFYATAKSIGNASTPSCLVQVWSGITLVTSGTITADNTLQLVSNGQLSQGDYRVTFTLTDPHGNIVTSDDNISVTIGNNVLSTSYPNNVNVSSSNPLSIQILPGTVTYLGNTPPDYCAVDFDINGSDDVLDATVNWRIYSLDANSLFARQMLIKWSMVGYNQSTRQAYYKNKIVII